VRWASGLARVCVDSEILGGRLISRKVFIAIGCVFVIVTYIIGRRREQRAYSELMPTRLSSLDLTGSDWHWACQECEFTASTSMAAFMHADALAHPVELAPKYVVPDD
jgi:hypothetical protein